MYSSEKVFCEYHRNEVYAIRSYDTQLTNTKVMLQNNAS